jgi:UDP-N-acetylmuramyl tripeptide synthase
LQRRGVLLVAGKGHERDLEVAGQFFPHDDRSVLRELAEEMGIHGPE